MYRLDIYVKLIFAYMLMTAISHIKAIGHVRYFAMECISDVLYSLLPWIYTYIKLSLLLIHVQEWLMWIQHMLMVTLA